MATSESHCRKDEGSILEICTFGQFLVRCGEGVLSEKAGRTNKAWELFKYLLTYKHKRVSSEIIVETLWPDQEYSDTRSSMRVLVHRVRQLFDGDTLTNHNPVDISFCQGCYTLKFSKCRLDADEFKHLSQRAYELSRESDQASLEAIELFSKAIALYKGEYLPEINSGWVLPTRSYLRRLYLRDILSLAELLKLDRRHDKIITLMEKAFLVEPYEEELNIRYLEALLERGKTTHALAHYEYITSVLYQEIGAKPSGAIRRMYQTIKRANERISLNFTELREILNEMDVSSGAFHCDPNMFHCLCQLEKRRRERTDNPAFIASISLSANELPLLPREDFKKQADQLEEVLLRTLRRGDVVCRLSENQFVLLLPAQELKEAKKVLKRIHGQYKEEVKLISAKLHSMAIPL